MAGLQTYEGAAEIYVQGRLLAEAVRTTVRISGNNNQVNTMRRGLAGKSTGPKSSEVTIESAIPRIGFERDFSEHLLSDEYIQVTLKSGGRRFDFECWTESCEITNAVDSPATYNITLMGGPPSVR